MRTTLIIFAILAAAFAVVTFLELLTVAGQPESKLRGLVLIRDLAALSGFALACAFGASVLGYLARQNAALVRTNELLSAVRDALNPPAPEPAPVVEPTRPAGRVERVEPRFGAD